jgi:dolichyl-phosphate beta-glucosyltransferase
VGFGTPAADRAMSTPVCWVVPCYNEAARLDTGALLALIDGDAAITLLFVNDGSRDATQQRLDELAKERPGQVRILSLSSNRGKGEAVRLGMLEALRAGSPVVGFFDADLATPASEIRRLTEVMRTSDADLLLGARVSMLGRRISRNPARHYLGRVLATAASLVLRLTVYDTQCGAKLFRRTPAFLAALDEPFHSRWLFDVELIGRMLDRSNAAGIEPNRMLEEPLREWRDIAGSKVYLRHFLTAPVDLTRISLALHRRRDPRLRL